MSTPISPYNELVRQLVLPQDIRAIVEKPFEERGCPLAPDTIYDYEYNQLTYLSSICNNQRVVLLHIAGDVISDRNNFRDVASIATLFSSKSAGLFFFAPVKDLNREYNITLATRLKEDNTAIKEARFFDQSDIESLKNKPPPLQKKLVSSLLALDALLAKGNGPKPGVTTTVLDLTQIQDRVIELLYQRYETAQEDPREFFVALRGELSWPPTWELEPKAQPRVSAREFVLYLLKQGSYPPGVRAGYKPLGDLLCCLIPKMGGDEAVEMYQIVVKYQLVETNALSEYRESLQSKYGLILPT